MSRIEIIRQLLSGPNKKLLYFLFPDADTVEDYGGSSMDLERIEANIGVLSSGEKILCRVAMDIWGGYGKADIVDICRRLDSDNFKEVMMAMIEFRQL